MSNFVLSDPSPFKPSIPERCCTLLNPSADIVQHLNQLATLAKIVGNTGINNDPDHICTTSINVESDTLLNSLDRLPSSFCLKVRIPESSIPVISDITDPVISIGHKYKKLDTICNAIMEHYKIDDQTIVVVLDLDQPVIVTPTYIQECSRLLMNGSSSKILILTVGYAKINMLAEWKSKLLDGNCIVLQHVAPEQILRIVTNCKHHILTGCLWGWWGALLSGSTNVVSPDPWTPGSHFTKINGWKYVSAAWPYSTFFNQIYYINLDRRTDRRMHMEKQLIKFNLSATRISAVDGAQISWKSEYGIMSNFWNSGAFAYCLSYRVAIINAITKGYDYVLIMDDDAVLTDNMLDVLQHAWKDLPEEWHMLYLGANHGHPTPTAMPTENDRIGDYLYRLSGSMGSHAIILNKVCFHNILNFVAAPYGPLDMFFSLYHKFFPCYITYPGLATQLAGHSDILNKAVNYTNDWNIDYINHIKGRTPV
jgi:glycosyl transferase family 25